MHLAVSHLQDQLDEITANTRKLVQPERLAISDRAIQELMLSGIESRALRAGDKAPPFELLDFTGKPVRSSDLLSLGPLVLSFFRGRWCPYCATELEAWQNLLYLPSRICLTLRRRARRAGCFSG